MSKVRELLLTPTEIVSEKKQAPLRTVQTSTGSFSLSLQASANPRPAANAGEEIYEKAKAIVHRKLLDKIDLQAILDLKDELLIQSAVENSIQLLIEQEQLGLSEREKTSLKQDVLNEVLGLGPLEPLLADPAINDIMVNGYDTVFVCRHGKLQKTDIRFQDEQHLVHIINRVVARIGRRIDESSPIVDARLPDGSRVNAITRPLSLDGPLMSIRRFRPEPYTLDDLINGGTVSASLAQFLRLSIEARLNILVSGGTSAGKTTLLNVLSAHCPDDERIITIEDTCELRLQQPHVCRLESRPANIEGKGAVSQRELVKNALRMRPDRIIVGEVRGPEALDMLQAMNTGHEGSLTTLHANSPRDALSRLETLVLLSGVELSQRSIREQIAAAFDLVVQLKRLADGSRRVVSVTEVLGMEESTICLQEIFSFKQTGISGKKVVGRHMSNGIRPSLIPRFLDMGIMLDDSLFANDKEVRKP